MIGRLIVADQKIALLKPLLHDKELIKKWDKSHGAHGLNLLNITLYFDLIRELAAFTLDNDKRSPSIKNILQLLESDILSNHLKIEFCKPLQVQWINDMDEDSKKFWEEKHAEKEQAEKSQLFDNSLSTARNRFKSLRASDLYKRIKNARNKLIAHYEMRNDGETPRMLDPTDIGLKWGDVEEYFDQVKPIITDLILIISNEGYALDTYRSQHERIANEFWYT